MGRPRKPTALKVLHGDRKDRMNPGEPKPRGELGEPPEYLDDDAREGWSWLALELEGMKVLTSAEGPILTLFSVAYSRWVKANRAVEEDGMTTLGQFGLKPHPMLAASDKAHAQMVKILGQLGMTPASRSSIGTKQAVKQDKLGSLLSRRTPLPDGKKTPGP